jgi:chromosome segregation ATPase
MTPEQRITRIEEKLDGLSTTLHAVDKTLVAQHASLKEHIRRTALAEDAIEYIRNDLKPVRAHIHRVDGVLKFIGFMALSISLLGGLLKIFSII